MEGCGAPTVECCSLGKAICTIIEGFCWNCMTWLHACAFGIVQRHRQGTLAVAFPFLNRQYQNANLPVYRSTSLSPPRRPHCGLPFSTRPNSFESPRREAKGKALSTAQAHKEEREGWSERRAWPACLCFASFLPSEPRVPRALGQRILILLCCQAPPHDHELPPSRVP